MTSFKSFKKNLLQNPLVAKEYDMLRPEFAIAQALISARIKAHMTQAEVAKSMHTSQSQVARLESGDHLPSLKSIHSYAKAIKHSITLEISAQ
jgi:DNA-binding XRE family transcriptional regulator